MPETTTRPFRCTRCGTQVHIGEEAVTWIDFGPAVLNADGEVRTPQASTEGFVGEPNPCRTYAVCTNPDCGHRWRLRRAFDGGVSLASAALAQPAKEGSCATRTAEPTCPTDGRKLQRVLYRRVHHFRCPSCGMVFDSVSGLVGEARGRISSRNLKFLDQPAKGEA